jgi:transcriptional regulator with XRE-family HTH domain
MVVNESEFNAALCERVKRWRDETGMTAADMAALLHIPADRYRKYETRSPLPAYLMPPFCQIIGVDLEHLLIGKARTRTKPVLVLRTPSMKEAS